VRVRGIVTTELAELEEKAASDRGGLNLELRANAKIAGVDWSRYQRGSPARHL
jgi:hypothetical protein